MAAAAARQHGTSWPANPDSPLTPEEDYIFDIQGWLVVDGVFTDAELVAASQQDGGQSLLSEHPRVAGYVEELCGPGYRLDSAVEPVPPGRLGPGGGPELRGGAVDGERGLRLRYENRAAVVRAATGGTHDISLQAGRARLCRGLRVVAALGDCDGDSGLVLSACSHKSSIPAPQQVLDGLEVEGTTTTVQLRKGQLLVAAATLLAGVRGAPASLLQAEFIAANVTALGPAKFPTLPPPGELHRPRSAL